MLDNHRWPEALLPRIEAVLFAIGPTRGATVTARRRSEWPARRDPIASNYGPLAADGSARNLLMVAFHYC